MGTAIAARDPPAFRVEALRTYLGELLGQERFVQLYREVVAARESVGSRGSGGGMMPLSTVVRTAFATNRRVQEVVAQAHVAVEHLVPLLYQLLHCEARAFL